MKYDRLDKKKAKSAKSKDELEKIAKMYHEADSFEEFKINAGLSDFSKSKHLKWFTCYYYLKNWSLWNCLPFVVGGILSFICIVQLIAAMLIVNVLVSAFKISNDAAAFGYVTYFILSVGITMWATLKICSKFYSIKDALLKYQ